MNKLIRGTVLALLVVVVRALPAGAQVLGYGVAGPAGYSGFFGSGNALTAAGGAEFLVRGRIGIAPEIGVFGPPRSALSQLSFNGVFHTTPSRVDNRLSPFVVGGRSAFGDGDAIFGTWNAGVGVDVWTKERLGFRLEFRDHIRTDSRGAVHYWTVRGGVVFR